MYFKEYTYHLRQVGKNIIEDYSRFRTLQRILKDRKLETYFQPIYDLQKKSLIGYEALNRPQATKAFPTTEAFYDYIGQSSHVFSLDLHCRNLSIERFHQEIVHSHHQIKPLLFINVHPDVLMDKNYQIGETKNILYNYQIEACQVVFELTERQAVTDYEKFKKVIQHYRNQGFRIAIDDAGTGFNSLQTLVHLKPEFIKLDRSLIHNIYQNKEQQRMVQLLIEFAQETNTIALAEGIETDLDLYYLQNLGVHLGQGYRLGKPSPNFTTNEMQQIGGL